MNNTPLYKQEDFITITEFWNLCRLRWRWFAFSLAVCLGLATYYLSVTPKMYTREAAVLVKLETNGRNTTSKITEEFGDIGLVQQSTNINNVLRHFKSLDVAMAVVEKLQLAKGENILPRAESLLRRLKVQIEDDKSTVITLKYVSEDPKKAEEILTALVQVYNEKWLEDKNSIATNTSQFIIDRLGLLSNELEGIDDSISVFKSRNQITNLDRVSDIYLQQQSQSEAQILTLSNQRAMAEYIVGIIQDANSSHQLLPTNSGINNQVAESQMSQYNSLILQINNHLTYTSSQNPLIENMEKELSDLRGNILRTIESQIKTIDIQLNSLYGYSGQAESKITSNPGQAKLLTSIERQQKVKESLYLYLLQKKEENALSLTYSSFITQLIDIPHGSDQPTSPNSRNIIIAAILLGLLVPAIVVFVRANMDNSVRDRQDVESKVSIPLVGDIPYCTRRMAREELDKKGKVIDTSRPIVVRPTQHNSVNEAFRVIRTNLEFMTNEQSHNNNVYIVTSSTPSSGKTFVSMNLAVAMAIAQKRVLFIDADLRHASATMTWFDKAGENYLGLTDYLNGKITDVNNILHQHPEYDTFDIMPVGTIPPNPTELLSSEYLGQLISELRPLYDYIFIDCPPAEHLADTAIIERHADRTLFVLRAGQFDRNRLPALENDYNSGKFKHMSLIINCTKPGRHKYNGGYGYNYYYYGKKKVELRDGIQDTMKEYMNNRVTTSIIVLGFFTALFTSCSQEVYSEYERVKTNFLQTIKGNIDPNHMWKTAVKVDVDVKSKEKSDVKSYVKVDRKKYLTDKKSLPEGGGVTTMTVPQGMSYGATIVAESEGKTKSQNITFSGSPVQNVTMDLIGTRSSDMPFEVASLETRATTKDEWGNHHAPNDALWGKSYLRPEDTPLYYTNWPVDIWRYVCGYAGESVDPSTIGETVNFELVSKGPFDITLFCGQLTSTHEATMGYYYHSEGSYDDYQEVDLCDIHQYDYLDGKPIIQYRRKGEWWDANYDMRDLPTGYKGDLKARADDECYNSVRMALGNNDITDMRGLTFHVTVPEGKRMGFYIRQDGKNEAAQEYKQRQALQKLGLPIERMHAPFKVTCFSSKKFNNTYDLEKPYRGWIHQDEDFYFMGIENEWDPSKCDHDCNDVMFAMTAGAVGVLPEVIDLDEEKPVNPDDPVVDEEIILPWTIAYEDVYRDADFDFNDGVIKLVPDFDNQQVCVTVLAAGIDEKVYLHYEAPDGTDMMLGELHEILGRTADRPVNTNSSVVEVPGVQVDCVPWPDYFTMANDAQRFRLEIVRGDCGGECSDWLQLAKEPGQLPQAILVAGEWKWPKESININNVYPNFSYWAKDATKLNYWEWYQSAKSGTYVSY